MTFYPGSREFCVSTLLSTILLLVVGANGSRLWAEEDAEEPFKPETVDLTTKDGVMIKATFYPGDATEKTVPLILLHDYKGDRTDLDDLAMYMHSQGHAVIVPDLRGHGESTRVLGTSRELEATRMRIDHFGRMVTQDLEAVKRYLMGLNNKSELNIQKLGLVGFGMGASVATAWAAHDWSWPEFATLKQGRDVKAIVLVSPNMNLRGLKMHDALMHAAISDAMSIQIIVGDKKGDSRRDADSIYKLLTRNRADQEKVKLANREVFLEQLDTSLQSTKLLEVKDLMIDKRIAKFVELRLTNINTPSFRWADRSKK